MKSVCLQVLLPNKPVLPEGVNHHTEITVDRLIALNGNHWRKILTILAKLVADEQEDWRIVRDQHIWKRVHLVFAAHELQGLTGIKMVVGKTFLSAIPQPTVATPVGAGRHYAYSAQDWLWTPYLDYRQFPNQLIEEIRRFLLIRH
ncbi:DUF6942 family protein [Marinomonas ostreistagni]|uniref:DUF6942 family protein n=1 Tax=Marinomonas ostreistagni TaxID=359209 RepID=UPI0019509A4C|nr:hypothetical protein [Marinomonas ostreistagni]MBM6550231.1 hypothetical protein [Marinomonas ostreistagni]